MSKLLKVLSRQFSLMVSLPKNSPEMARAAVEAGAQSLKIHLNCHHHASGTTFGSWTEEQSAVKEVLAAVDVPVGMVTGEVVQPSADELEEIREAGFDFWDLFAKFTPPGHLALEMGRMVAVDSSWTSELLHGLKVFGVHVLEGSVIPKTEYGTPLNLVDLATYISLCKACAMPVLIPTQKKILPAEVGHLRAAGAAGLTIGAIVTGLEVGSLREATGRFAEAIGNLPPPGNSGYDL